MKKTITTSALVLTMAALTSIYSTHALAHVTVKPVQAGISTYQTFTTSVPNEKDIPTTSIRLVIPDGFVSVMPNVKPGWTIQTKSVKDGETSKVSEIIWSGGSIPVGQRDEFIFSAKTPATESTVLWKAYQTYQNGTIVAWDIDPIEQEKMTKEAESKGEKVDHSDSGPASSTKIINDLDSSGKETIASQPANSDKTSQLMAGVAMVASFAALALGLRKK